MSIIDRMKRLIGRERPNKIKGVIFDLDGLLVDSEPINFEADSVLLSEFGVNYTKEDHQNVLGRPIIAGLEFYIKRFGLKISIPEMIEKRKKHQLILIPKIKLMPGAIEALNLCRERELKLALATSGFREYAEEVIKNCGVADYFEVTLTADDVKNGKPDPEIFLLSARKLGLSPSECLVLEDSLAGVTAGLAAGCRVIAVPTIYAKGIIYPKEATIKKDLFEAIEYLKKI